MKIAIGNKEPDDKLPPITPGEILLEEFLLPANMNPIQLALKIHVPVSEVMHIITNSRRITPDIALKLSQVLKTTPDFWINLQNNYDKEAGT